MEHRFLAIAEMIEDSMIDGNKRKEEQKQEANQPKHN